MSGERGMALLVVVVLMLAGTALAHGVLVVARQELAAASQRVRLVERTSAERAALRRAREAASRDIVRATAGWGAWSVPDSVHGGPGVVRMRRLGPESWWLETLAEGADQRSPGTPGVLLWWLDPIERVERLGAVVTVGAEAPVTVTGELDPSRFGLSDPPLSDDLCAPETDGRFEGVVPSAVGRLPGETTRPGLGLLDFDALLARTEVRVGGSGAAAPVEEMARCLREEPWNWGDPDRPWRPCGVHLAVRAAPEGLHVTEGAGQGAWVVDGDMVLDGETRLYGVVIASGRLVLRDRSRFHGVAIPAGGLTVEAGAEVRGSACWAVRGVRAGAALWSPRPVPVPDTPLIGP
ncbi:MAG: hypothetical protein U5R14_04340 [Gemmatimonadota bacterium]|nr:hypothetical protein [Gemmatimonadota bacterium]